MNDDFDKHDDDFDWLGDDDDDEQSSSDESGLTGQLSWLDDAESSPDAGRSSDDTDDLDLDWLDQGEDEGAPPSEDATGVTGELSWLSEDTLEDSPDLQVPRSDTKPFWSDADADEEPSESEAPVEDVPDWLRDDESDAEPVESATEEVPDPDEESPGWLANIGETGALSAPDEEDEHPSWLANVGDTGTLNREESEPDLDSPEEADETPDWLSDMGIGQSSAEEDTAEEPAVRDDDPEWLSGLGLESEEETVEPAEEAYPDMDSLFGFGDDVYDEGDTVQPAAQDQDTDWLDQYDEDEEFGIGAEPTFAETSGESSDTSDTDWLDQYDDHREESEEPAVSADDDEAVEKDTGWLEYGEAEEVEYDPYATYEEDFDDDVEYDEVFSSDTSSLVDTGMLTEKSDLFDEEQPVSEAFSEDETPDWLASYSDDEFGEQDEPAPQPAMIESDTEWLDQFDDESFDDADFGEPPLDPLDDVPDWLKGDDNIQEEPESEPEMAEDDLFSDLETDESDHTPTGLTGELEDVDDEEELDFDLLDELDEDITSGSTGLTGELANLDESDFDFLDEIDFDDIDVDDIDLEELTASDLTDELSEIEGDQDQISTGFTGELEAADEDMDLSFLDEVEEEDVEPAETGLTDEPETADEDMDLSFLDEVEVSEDAPDRAAAGLTDELEITEAEEELDLSFLDEAEDDERTDWFDESEEVEDREPDWMRTLNEVDVDELVTEAGDRDFEDIFGDADFDVEDEELSDMDVPAADLDSLLATFDDVEEEEFAEDPGLSQADDLDAIFDAALSEQTDEDDLPGHIPEWLRDVDVSSDESSAAAIIRQQSDKPIEELDDRLQALREKALSASSRADEDADHDTPNILSGVPETLAPAHIAHETEELASDITLTSNQQKQAQLLEDIVGVTITPTVETDEEGIPIVESSRRRRRALPNVGLPRLLVALILLLVMILPFVANIQMGDLPPLAFGADNRSANAVFNQIETLQDGDWVLVGFEYAPTAAGELDSVADILLRHIFSQGAQPIIVSSNPVAIVHAQNILDDIHQSLRPSGLGIEANRDYYIVRYLPGGTLGLRDLTQNLESVVGIDAKGTPTRLGLTSLDELALMLVIAERSDDIRNWAEQIVPSTSTRLVAATGYAAQPLAEPYVDQTDGIVGLVVGYRDAYTYGEMLQGVYATATPQPTATFTLTFTPSPTPTMTDTPSPTETPLPTDTPDDTGVQTDDTEQVVPVEATATEVVATQTPTLTTTPTSSPTSTATATLTDEPTETATPSPSPSPTPNLITVIVVTAPDASVNVRTGPSTDFNVLTTAQTGDVFQVIGENDDGSWINFLLPDGREGWIAAFLVEKTELPEGEIESDESADTGQGVTVMRVKYHRRMGKNRVRYYQQAPTETPTSTVTGTPPTATPTLTFTPSVTPTATLTPTATPDLRANFVFSREREEENSRLSAMTLGTVAAVIIILFGNIFYGLRVIVQRRRESKR